MTQGMSRTDGTQLTADDHLDQSVDDILGTRIGTRICRRDYGSLVPELIDQPTNLATKLRLISATATALIRWEPRIRIRQVTIIMTPDNASFWGVTVDGTRTDTGSAFSYTSPIGAAA